ncbi:MAG: hypothetical protein JW751_10370 [Polyangiaceae bacterium]|nr:hypothetical protein [Polyangiaceae bacterium]
MSARQLEDRAKRRLRARTAELSGETDADWASTTQSADQVPAPTATGPTN